VPQSRQGFTLFELVLVLALIIMLAAIAFPSLDSMYGGFKVTSAEDLVRSAWARARAQAINDGIAYRFCVAPGKGNFRIAPDTDEFWTGNDGAAANTDLANPPLIVQDVLPKGVRFLTGKPEHGGAVDSGGDTIVPAGGVDPSSWASPIVFLPDGTARDDAELTLSARGANARVLRLRGLTGIVTSRALKN
jgi:type II secretory pathway pseudopilin PulG